MKNLLLTAAFLVSSMALASSPATELGAYQVDFDGNPIFNLYGLCVKGDTVQSITAYSNCDTWGTEGCRVLETPSHHPEKILRYEMVCKEGTEGWEGGCASYDQVSTLTSFPLRYQVTVVDSNYMGGEEAEVLGYTTYTIPNCK